MAIYTLKTQAYLDPESEAYALRAFGVRRWAYNFFVRFSNNKKKETNIRPRYSEMMKHFRKAIDEKSDSDFEWILENMVATRVLEETSKDVEEAYARCTDATKENYKKWKYYLSLPGEKRGKKRHRLKKIQPKYKTRKDRTQTFSVYNGSKGNILVEDDKTISFAGTRKFRPSLKTRESLTVLQGASIKRLTLKREAGKYWVCVAYEILNRSVPQPTTGKVGIDLGVKISVVSYDGTTARTVNFNTKNSLKSDKLARSVDLSRKLESSKHYEKAVLLQQRRAFRSKMQRKAALEEYTTFLCRNYKEIVIDDYSFKGALAVADHGELYRSMKYEFKLRLEQKAQDYGNTVRYVDHRQGQRTTRKCACCGSHEVSIKRDRVMHCRKCGFEIDRDFNAAINCYLI